MANVLGTTALVPGFTCIFGRVTVFPTGLIGAVNGTITPLFSTPIPITQVVGPAGGPISLNQVNGTFALVCGTFTPSAGQCRLNVSLVVPLGFLGLGGLGTTGLGTLGLGGLGTLGLGTTSPLEGLLGALLSGTATGI